MAIRERNVTFKKVQLALVGELRINASPFTLESNAAHFAYNFPCGALSSRWARAETFIQHPISSVINCRMSYTVLIQRPERNVSSPSRVSNLHHLITQDAMLALEFVSFSEERRVLEWNRREAMNSFQPRGEWIVRNVGHRVAARTIDWLCLSCKLKP